MTTNEAVLAVRLDAQTPHIDVSLNNPSHGLCMLDRQCRLRVWNDHFIELLHLEQAPLHAGMRASDLARHCIHAGHYDASTMKTIFRQIARGMRQDGIDHVQISPDGGRMLALSRRTMSDGGSVLILEDITERKRAQEHIARLARFDPLTGLANRAQFQEDIGDLLEAVRRGETNIAIHLVDLDRFKIINDTLGHPLGDKLLKDVASRLVAITGPSGTITRFGGDEFIVVQTTTPRRQDAEWLAQRLATALNVPFEIDGNRIDIGASIGIAMAPCDGTDAAALLKKADMALYAAKSIGGGSHCFFAREMEDAAQARRALELDFREALINEQFELYFQPLVDLGTSQITACETLIRWHHPVRGNVLPAEFIPIAEETGLIIALGEWILHRACAEAATWAMPIKVAVNLSPVQFRTRGLVLQVLSALTKAAMPAQRLELEITERVLLEESDETHTALQQFEALGVSLSLDDFGTGYSSLNYLRKFPFRKIKIDKSFIQDLGKPGEARAIIGAVASLGAGLDKIVVAEGIETEEHLKLARAQGCHEGQGYFIDRPMSAAAIRRRLEVLARNPRQVA